VPGEEEHVLSDDAGRRVVRCGDTVRRPTYEWSGSVHDLLGFLEQRGFKHAPRFLGFDDDGREVLSFLSGEAGAAGWAKVVPPEGLVAFAGLLASYHRVVADYRPAGVLPWSTRPAVLAPGQLICHGDFGPWNVVWDGRDPVGLLDWDHARPGDALDDVAYAAEHVVPFRDDATCVDWLGFPTPPDRRRRLRIFAQAYGTEPAAIPERVARLQRDVIGAVATLAAHGVQPQETWVERGYLDELSGRLAWTEASQHLFT